MAWFSLQCRDDSIGRTALSFARESKAESGSVESFPEGAHVSVEGGIPGNQRRFECPKCGKVFFAWRPDAAPGVKIKCYFCKNEIEDEAAKRTRLRPHRHRLHRLHRLPRLPFPRTRRPAEPRTRRRQPRFPLPVSRLTPDA